MLKQRYTRVLVQDHPNSPSSNKNRNALLVYVKNSYNEERYLKRCISDCHAQSLENYY